MSQKNKKLNEKVLKIVILSFMLGGIIGSIITGIITIDNSDYLELKEDYDWLEKSSIDCWNKLRILDDECWDANDCIDNPNLKGCHQIEGDCNWCCYNQCTLVYCGGLSEYLK